MAIVSLTNLLSFCDVDIVYFVVDGAHDVLKLTDSTGGVQNIEVDDNTYTGTELASELQSKARAGLDSTGVTVDYSIDTKKFTINATGDTMTFTLTGSDAALLFGFNQDHLTAAESITSDVAAGDPSAILASIRDGVEDWVENYCHKVFESDSYSKYYDGNGGQYLQLDDYPITALTRVAIGRRSAIRVKNTADYTTANISVTTTGLSLIKDGGTPDTITFTDEETMGEVVTKINTLGSGWSAVIESSDYTSFKSTELVEMFGKSAIEDNWVYLDMPNRAIDDFEVFPNRGEIYRGMGWPEGNRNIFVEDTAGYSSATMPKNLQLAVKIITKSIFQKRKEEIFGVKQYKVGDVSITCEDSDVPREALAILSRFKRHLI